jgi:hypothetical protein
MVNFYEKLDKIFNKLTTENPEYFNMDILQMKSDIIDAYEYDNNHKGDFIAKLIKVKHFKISEDGKIVSV